MKPEALSKAQRLFARYADARGQRGLRAEKKSEKEGSLYVYDVIGEDFWTGEGVTAKGVVAELEKLRGAKTLHLYINSPGGDVFEGEAILANLRRFEGRKVVHVDGLAASAASLIAMVGDEILIQPEAMFMIHEAWSIALGNAEDMRAMADILEKMSGAYAETYAERTGLPAEKARDLMRAETWMTAKEAVELGFASAIEGADYDEDEPKKKTESRVARFAAQTQERIALGKAGQQVKQNHERLASLGLRRAG